MPWLFRSFDFIPGASTALSPSSSLTLSSVVRIASACLAVSITLTVTPYPGTLSSCGLSDKVVLGDASTELVLLQRTVGYPPPLLLLANDALAVLRFMWYMWRSTSTTFIMGGSDARRRR